MMWQSRIIGGGMANMLHNGVIYGEIKDTVVKLPKVKGTSVHKSRLIKEREIPHQINLIGNHK